jgi:hypothetical protein
MPWLMIEAIPAIAPKMTRRGTHGRAPALRRRLPEPGDCKGTNERSWCGPICIDPTVQIRNLRFEVRPKCMDVQRADLFFRLLGHATEAQFHIPAVQGP